MLWLSPSGSLYVNSGGAPFDATAAELAACCCCKWYKIRTSYYDADCTDVNDGYNDTPSCECRCLIAGNPPDPLPAGKTVEDYVGSYPIQDSTYRSELFGPYDDAAACAAAKIEGCDYAWGCSWDAENSQGRYWYHIHHLIYFSSGSCTGNYSNEDTPSTCLSEAELGEMDPGVCHQIFINGIPQNMSAIAVVMDGPESRTCDLT